MLRRHSVPDRQHSIGHEQAKGICRLAIIDKLAWQERKASERVPKTEKAAAGREILRSQQNSEVCGDAEDGNDAIRKARELRLDVILLEPRPYRRSTSTGKS